MKIGIIGPELSGRQIQAHLRAISPETETILYPRETAAGALEVIDQCEAECTAVLFTGVAVCSSVIQHHTMTRSYEYVTKDAYSLMNTLRQMERQGQELDGFSIDAVEPHVVEDAFSECGITPRHIRYLPIGSSEEEPYIQWHQTLWDRGESKAILTGFVWVYHHFREKGYPVFYLSGSRFTVREAFNRLETRLKLKEAHSAQIVVEIIELDNVSESAGSYYSDRLRICQCESLVTEYCRRMEASFFRSGQNRYIIFANRGGVKREENYQRLYVLQSKILKTGLHPNMGIGLGSTAYQSEIHASKALSHAKAAKGSFIYMVDENGALTGPLGSERAISYDLISRDEQVEQIARETGMSGAYIAKLMALIQLRGDAEFDVKALADCLNITVRSAHRIIRRLLERGYASVCGKESSGAGRPRALVRLHFGRQDAGFHTEKSPDT